jgi:ribosome maturation factor RimP
MDLEEVIGSVVEAAGLDLYEVSLGREAGRRVLRVAVSRDSGVDLDAIGEVSERIGRRLDLEGFDPGPYALEVGSPGLERPLRTPRQFGGAIGETVRMKTFRQSEGTSTLEGTLVRAGDEDVTVQTETGERTVPYGDIGSARTVFVWGPTKKV